MNDMKFKATNIKTGEEIIFSFSDFRGYEGEVCGVILPDDRTVLVYNKGNDDYEAGGLNPDLHIDLYE